MTEGVSVILHALNAQAELPGFMNNLRRCEVLEVILCDEDSTDDTIAIARGVGASILIGEAGRTVRTAILQARGTVLWFLAPHCIPPEESGLEILELLYDYDTTAGWCPLRGVGWGMDLHAMKLNLAAGLLGRMEWENGLFARQTALSEGLPEHLGSAPLRTLRRRLALSGGFTRLTRPVRLIPPKRS